MKNIRRWVQFLILLGISLGANAENSKTETAIFAGGCFWCMQGPFDQLKTEGVVTTKVGYTGGQKEKPTYEETSSGKTGHREAIEITYDPKKIAFAKLLDVFWANIDPIDGSGQFCDKGEQYTSAVFFTSESQQKDYQASLDKVKKLLKVKGEIKTALLPAKPFYAAEDYHQSYYTKNPIRYKYYRSRCGRDQRLKEVWGQSPKHD